MDTIRKPAKSRHDPWVGKVIAEKYQLETLIGSGGMGAVYVGKHLQLGRTVAIKVMNTDIASDKTASARFIREAKASAKLEHPNTVTIHDFGTIDNNAGAFIVMEYISGQTLRKYLATNGPLPLEKALEWFVPICDVIEKAHNLGIIHRDLKPENIMLKNVGEEVVVKVVDFGLAKISTDSDVSISQKLTQTGEFMGTPQYMAPEIYDGEAADNRADIYALGIILYELITGKVPFAGSVQNIISGHLFKDPPLVITLNPNLPAVLDRVLKLALEKKRENRITSALGFANAFKQVVDPSDKVKIVGLSGNANILSHSVSFPNDINKINTNKPIDTGLNLIEGTGKSKVDAVTLVDFSSDLPTLHDSIPKTIKVEWQGEKVSQENLLPVPNKELSSKGEGLSDGQLSLFKQKPWVIFILAGALFVVLVIAIFIFKSMSQNSLDASPSTQPKNEEGNSLTAPTPSPKKGSSKIISETKPLTEKELQKKLGGKDKK